MSVRPVPARHAPAAPFVNAVAALRQAIGDVDGRLRTLLDGAAAHLDRLLAESPPEAIAAVAVPAAVFRALRPGPVPPGLLAAGAATYLALDVLDDQMDGEPPAFWRDRRPGEVALGTQLLLQTAVHDVARGTATARADRLRTLYRRMLNQVADGQLRTEEPITAATTAAQVHATISARSGTMLAGFAAMAAVAAGAPEPQVEAAQAFGHELGLARQHLNDVTELLGERTSDLSNATATMPLALALQATPEGKREALVQRLRLAAEDGEQRRLLVRDLAPSIADVVVLVQLHLAAAGQHAAFLGRPGVRHDDLDRLIQFTADTVRRHHVR